MFTFVKRITSESGGTRRTDANTKHRLRSEEHTSELQSPDHLVCRLLLEKKKYTTKTLGRALIGENSFKTKHIIALKIFTAATPSMQSHSATNTYAFTH